MSNRIPEDLVYGKQEQLHLFRAELDALESAEEAVLNDVRFEHLEKRTEEAVWRFACRAHLQRSESHVSGFVDEHRRDPFDAICYLPVFNLTVQEETEVLGLRLLNPSDPRIPQSPSPHALDELEPGAGSVAAVDARGTSYSRMAERSKETASHKLRLLRVAL